MLAIGLAAEPVPDELTMDPATDASYVAAVCLKKYEKSVEAAQRGLIANPQNLSLHNNAALALAALGRAVEAEKHLEQIKPKALEDAHRAVWLATSGLIAYRKGNPERGSQLYREAVELAKVVVDRRLLAYALLFNAREAMRLS